jgi:hypothetical protein
MFGSMTIGNRGMKIQWTSIFSNPIIKFHCCIETTLFLVHTSLSSLKPHLFLIVSLLSGSSPLTRCANMLTTMPFLVWPTVGPSPVYRPFFHLPPSLRTILRLRMVPTEHYRTPVDHYRPERSQYCPHSRCGSPSRR